MTPTPGLWITITARNTRDDTILIEGLAMDLELFIVSNDICNREDVHLYPLFIFPSLTRGAFGPKGL